MEELKEQILNRVEKLRILQNILYDVCLEEISNVVRIYVIV